MNDPLLCRLAALPAAEPDPARAALLRARCHAQLAPRVRLVALHGVRRAGRFWPPS